MKNTVYCGWDIGGAHLKLACIDAEGDIISASQMASPLWKGIDTLKNVLSLAREQLPDTELFHSVTTTAELVDIFSDRHEGVLKIKQELCHLFDEVNCFFYAGNAGMVPSAQVENYTNQIASSNWHATASYISRFVKNGILVDVGSTTTDIIPFGNKNVLNKGNSDFERMQSGELVYTGIIRTPVMAMVESVPYQGYWASVAAENFATMADIYRLTGELNEIDDMMETADGAGKEINDSARRLARMLGIDFTDISLLPHWKLTARYITEQQLMKIQQALLKVLYRMDSTGENLIVGAGAGRFVVEKLARRNGLKYMDISTLLKVVDAIKDDAARCATALSVAQVMRCSV